MKQDGPHESSQKERKELLSSAVPQGLRFLRWYNSGWLAYLNSSRIYNNRIMSLLSLLQNKIKMCKILMQCPKSHSWLLT